MPPVNRKRLLARAPNLDKTEAGVKALVSVFFLFLPPLPAFAQGELAPEPLLPCRSTSVRLPLLSCLAQSLPLAPTVNLTSAIANFAVVDGGAPAARYSGSAAGAGGQRD